MKKKFLFSFIAIFFLICTPFSAQSGWKRGGTAYSYQKRKHVQKQIKSFNGMRISATHAPFQVMLIESTKTTIRISFNAPLNPASIKKENILINDIPLDDSADFRFNKTGKLLEFKTLLTVGTKFTLELKGVKAYDGASLTATKFTSLLPWTSKEYPTVKFN